MHEVSPMVLGYLLAGTAGIAEVFWYYSKRKALRFLTLPREIRKCEARYRRYHLRLTLMYIVLGIAILYFGLKQHENESLPEDQIHNLLGIDSSEVDEFLEQYKEEKLNQEIE